MQVIQLYILKIAQNFEPEQVIFSELIQFSMDDIVDNAALREHLQWYITQRSVPP